MNPLKFDDLRYLQQPVQTLEERELMLGRSFHWISVMTTAYSRTLQEEFWVSYLQRSGWFQVIFNSREFLALKE